MVNGCKLSISHISLNLLRAFDASARHLSFTKAAKELCVTQAAVAHQVKALEDYLQKPLFNRIARGLSFTDDGALLAPIIAKSFNEISIGLDKLKRSIPKTSVNVGVVGTFALGFLLPRLGDFHAKHPNIEAKIMVNNNVPDLLNEHLDFAIRFGQGAWAAQTSESLMGAPLTPLCNQELADKIKSPSDLARFSLLRSHRASEWPIWLEKHGASEIIASGAMFDNSRSIADAAKIGLGVGLLPKNMFENDLQSGELIAPFNGEIDAGSYFLTRLVHKPMTEAMKEFRDWLIGECKRY